MTNIEKELILLVGPIGSGKTTFAKTLLNDNSIRISQDEMGRKGHMKEFNSALEQGIPRIIVDRMNFNRQQRARYIQPARDAGYIVTIIELDTEVAKCHDRVVRRTSHPTIPSNDSDLASKILNMYFIDYEKV